MTASYAFFFDAASCTGCKACQVACKDKNNLPPGVLWRRVFEVSGGDWTMAGQAWKNTVFAYNLSLACNHCTYPKCAGVCPVDAYTVREDGIVLLDSSKCLGCGYCAWACPYNVPQYDPLAGTMSKCNLCFDNIDAGLPPACTAACPMRALEIGDLETALPCPPGSLALWQTPAVQHPFPLPTFSRTEPHTAIKPHPAMSLPVEKQVANEEEIRPLRRTGWEEAPLVAFTLLAQMAIGGLWVMSWMFKPLWLLVRADSPLLELLPVLVILISLGFGMLASFAHLGRKRNAWRAVRHLRKSWISREILFALLFGMSLLGLVLAELLLAGVPALLSWFSSLLGLGLLFSMARVYHLRAVPAWNTWRTEAAFVVSTVSLGSLLMASVFAFESAVTGFQIMAGGWIWLGVVLLALLLVRLFFMVGHAGHKQAVLLWWLLLFAGLLAVSAVFIFPRVMAWPVIFAVFLLALAGEAIGRWLFYESRVD